jgi:hypothetical protein
MRWVSRGTVRLNFSRKPGVSIFRGKSCTKVLIAERGLRISCAMPAARVPNAASLSDCRIRASSRFNSVMS